MRTESAKPRELPKPAEPGARGGARSARVRARRQPSRESCQSLQRDTASSEELHACCPYSYQSPIQLVSAGSDGCHVGPWGAACEASALLQLGGEQWTEVHVLLA
jgi:hypothetical protein